MPTEMISHEVLIAGAKEIFETMIFLDLKVVDHVDEHADCDTVLGTITFTGDIEGCLGVNCGKECAQTIAASMLGMDSGDDLSSQDVHDAMGEVCNMVMGCIKASLTDDFGDIQVSIPTVVSGHEIAHDMGDHNESVVSQVMIADQYCSRLSLQWRHAESGR